MSCNKTLLLAYELRHRYYSANISQLNFNFGQHNAGGFDFPYEGTSIQSENMAQTFISFNYGY